MPRKSRAKKQLDQTVAVAEPLETTDQISELQSDQPPPDREVVTSPEQDPVRHSHAAAVLANRPDFQPVPSGFKNVARHESAGLRVNRGVERHNAGTAALQFEEGRPLSRATEYDLMEQIQTAGFKYQPATRQWERPLQEGMELGDNAIDATRIAKEIADARNVGRGR